MKIIKKVINYKKRVFAVRMNLDQNTDDVWNIYNLINVGDLVTGTCNRKVQKEATTLVKIEKKTFTATLKVKSFQYDAENDSLRISGINATENKYIGIGFQQSMDIRPPRQIMIVKKEFDSMHVKRLNQMQQEADQGHLVAITMEEGIAHIFMVTQQKSILKAKIEKSVAKVNKGFSNKHTASKNKFFDSVIAGLEKHFSGENADQFAKVNCVVVGSPGFVRENFFNYLKERAAKQGQDFAKDLVSKIILSHCSSGFKHSLNELLSSQAVTQKIQSMSCANETAALDKFFETLAICEDKVTYGPKSVEIALREMAVETLLISDKLFRAKNIEQRKFYVKLYEKAQKDGLNVVIFGSMSSSGIRLNNLTGIAAILRFEMTDLKDMFEDDEGDIDSEEEGEMSASATTSNKESDSQANSQKEDDDGEERKSAGASQVSSEAYDEAAMQDIFMQMGDVDYGDEDYGDEDDLGLSQPAADLKKHKSHN